MGEEDLMMRYKIIVRSLHLEYAAYANKLSQQKQSILNNLQMQFNERRSCLQHMIKRAECVATVEMLEMTEYESKDENNSAMHDKIDSDIDIMENKTSKADDRESIRTKIRRR